MKKHKKHIKSNTYLNNKSVCKQSLFLSVLKFISQYNQTSSYFITVYSSTLGTDDPHTLSLFLQENERRINQGANNRRFIYRYNKWRLILTYYPKHKVVSEYYALKNKVFISI